MATAGAWSWDDGGLISPWIEFQSCSLRILTTYKVARLDYIPHQIQALVGALFGCPTELSFGNCFLQAQDNGT